VAVNASPSLKVNPGYIIYIEKDGKRHTFEVAEIVSVEPVKDGLSQFSFKIKSIDHSAMISRAEFEGGPQVSSDEVISAATVYNISDSNVQIGNHNVQEIKNAIEVLGDVVRSSSVPEEEKAEAKSLLASLCEHPLFTAVLGGAVSGVAASFTTRVTGQS